MQNVSKCAQHRGGPGGGGGGGGMPEWLTSDDASGMSSAERQRQAFEAERQKLVDQRRRQQDAQAARAEAGGPRERPQQGTSAVRRDLRFGA